MSAAATVIIGGLPAARVGDSAICVGPTDTIATGSASVLIEGRLAARVGDTTAHGGTILCGCPTVLIGDATAPGRGTDVAAAIDAAIGTGSPQARTLCAARKANAPLARLRCNQNH